MFSDIRVLEAERRLGLIHGDTPRDLDHVFVKRSPIINS